jgi:hypothetical protein
MSYYWLRAAKTGYINELIYAILRTNLPNTQYPQTPDLEGAYIGRIPLDEDVIVEKPVEQHMNIIIRIINWFKNLWK